MKAIVSRDLGHAELVYNHALPKVRDDCILVKTVAVALNPIDWMKVDGFPAPGAIQGQDYAGVVEQVGESVKNQFRKGDRVCGCVRGGDSKLTDIGAFADYIVAKPELTLHIPDEVSFEQAATMGSGVLTAGVALGYHMKLEQPSETSIQGRGEYLLVYGGSTASAAICIQIAKLSGYKVIATCSEQNFGFVKSLGAEAVFDYKDPDCAKHIRDYCADQLKIVLDTIATPNTVKICSEALSSKGGRYCGLLPTTFPRSDVDATFVDTTAGYGEYYEYGPDKVPIQADPRVAVFAADFFGKVDKLWAKGLIRTHEVEVSKDGLNGIFNGLQLLRNRQVSAKKLVYRVDDTPAQGR